MIVPSTMAIRSSMLGSSKRNEEMEVLSGSVPVTGPLLSELQRITELEAIEKSLRLSLEVARTREKKLVIALEEFGVNLNMIEMESGPGPGGANNKNSIFDCPLDNNQSFLHSLFDRGGWLCGLLVFQSCSSFILASNQELISAHPAIVFFLTMLVGAGGNAGNQAAVRVSKQMLLCSQLCIHALMRIYSSCTTTHTKIMPYVLSPLIPPDDFSQVIRGIAVGALNEHTTSQFIIRELIMAFSLSSMLGAGKYKV
jgi:hypothetical protein